MWIRIFLLSFTILPMIASAQFIEKSSQLNIDHIHLHTHYGGGATFFDFNNDGFLDLYVTGGGHSDKLYMNLGDRRFHDVSEESGISFITEKFQTSSVISGDVNNDGCSDLFVTTFENRRNLLLINQCDGSFQVNSFQYGLTEETPGMGAAFLDYNQDGLLDLYVANYIRDSNLITNEEGQVIGFDHECWPNYFYINQGNGQFIERSADLLVNDEGCGLAVVSADINQDNTTDLYVVNDFGEWVKPNSAYQNEFISGGFLNISEQSYLDRKLYGMGVASGDFDNDMDMDFYLTNIAENQLLQNNGTAVFADVASEKGVQNASTDNGLNTTGWGTFFFDYDNDADLDLFVSNGYIGTAEFLATDESDPNKLFENNGEAFLDVTAENNLGLPFRNRGAVYGDYDNDGDLDLFVVTLNAVDSLYSPFYENQVQNRNNWIDFQLEGTESNRDAIGAQISIYFNGLSRIHQISSGGSHASQSSLIAHFGLGDADHVDSVMVYWGNERYETFRNIPVNQKIYIREATGKFEVMGCMETNNLYYNALATYNSGCKTDYIIGCIDSLALNYNSKANLSGDCIYDEEVTALQNEIIKSFEIYPNPARENLIIKHKGNLTFFNVRVLTLTGYEVFSKNDIFAEDLELKLSHLSEGLYILIIENKYNKEPVYIGKFLKN